MGYYTRKRNIRKFWKNPLPNLCYTLAVISFVAGVFGLFALIGKAKTLPFTIIALALGCVLIVVGNKLNTVLKKKEQESNKGEN